VFYLAKPGVLCFLCRGLFSYPS